MQSASNPSLGWHNADIVAALKRKGFTQRALSIKSGLSPSAVSVALAKPWPRVEQIIADAIGVPPDQIWPPRYSASLVTIKRGRKVKAARLIHGQSVKKRCPSRTARAATA